MRWAFTFNVADLDRVADHLDKVGVKIQSRTADTIVTDPGTSLQVPWGFTTARGPGDNQPGRPGGKPSPAPRKARPGERDGINSP